MENAYAVFFDKQKIHFVPWLSAEQLSRYSVISYKPDWATFISFIASGKPSMACVSNDPPRQFRAFATMFHLVEAAGGLVADPKDHWLFICKRDRWDLPKGIIDKGETPQEAALREISEECGIGELEIIHKLDPTYHVYPLNESGQWAFKKTHWFFVRTRICCQADPQTSEGITKAEWKHHGELDDVMDNTYGNIKVMLEACQSVLK